MTKTLLFSVFVGLTFQVFSQTMPSVKVGEDHLKLTTLDVESSIVGNIATTTYSMTFYNPEERILEGELAFPLSQGQSVTNFAMDVNGKMRDAVIVEKELGRVAYESTIRQTIDPGLLEITKGNNYKARVYPIPANGYKKLSITFEEEMKANGAKHVYEIPFNFLDPLEFSCQMLVYNTNQNPKIKGGKNYKLQFKEEDGILRASVKKSNALVDTSMVLEFPIGNPETVTTYNNYFNVYKFFEPKARVKQKPKHITIFWDSSYSMKFRDLETELEVLDKYFNYLDDVNVDFVTFSNNVSEIKAFSIKNGNWKALKKDIEAVVYDGGTSYLDIKSQISDEVLFFSDGMFNLGQFPKKIKGNLYAINSVKSSNHEFLEQVANTHYGKYINLNILNENQAFNDLKTESFKFLGVSKNDAISEVYPKSNTTVKSDFSVSGQFSQNTNVQLNFGYANQITETVNVNLVKSSFNGLVKRIWAKKKLQYLNSNKEENKDEIINLAKKNHLITDYTSLIILDRIEDYVRYEIEPPKELKAAYKERIAANMIEKENSLQDIKNQKKQLFEDYKELMNWYNTEYPIAIKKPKQVATVNNEIDTTNMVRPIVESPTPQPNIQPTIRVEQTALDPNKRIVSGTILADDGLALPGASIIIKGTSRGVQTDFDGNFSINAEIGDIILVHYIGFISAETTVDESHIINLELKTDDAQLDEVVITGYAGATRSMSVSSAVSVVESESVTEGVKTLLGQAAGVQISTSSGITSDATTITIRGRNSISKSTPLYVIDGKVISDRTFKQIATDSIHNMTVLKEESATSIFGNRGSNGVVVITTKKGLETNFEEIQELNDKIREDINFKPWSPESDYIKILQAQTNVNDAYKQYLELRNTYRNTPSFFIDVADYFDSKQAKVLAIKVLSNLAEIDLDNHEVMRALAYKLEYFEQYDLALHVCKEVLKLRPEEPQSTRDLALPYQNIGDYQKAFDLLYSIVEGRLVEKDLDQRFYGIEHLAFVEACHVVQKFKNEISLNKTQQELIKPIQVDLRIVAEWNHNDTDLDLWVDNPKNQMISYKNRTSNYGDRLSEDMTEGYGPEEFMIKKGLKGEYNIELDYYADEVQKISGPTTVKITIFKNYGSKDETKEVRVFRLDNEKDVLEIGSITF
ncbi:VIT domain-containing protein [Psychroserpens sp.]|uniref:VIT domain-containing protein n=1 Tax=Psychroserpens sp. TaxID=2020870 RepID=UPI003C74559C